MDKVKLSIFRQKLAGTWERNEAMRVYIRFGYPLAYIGSLFPKDGKPLSRQRVWSIGRASSCLETHQDTKQGRFKTFIGDCIKRAKKLLNKGVD